MRSYFRIRPSHLDFFSRTLNMAFFYGGWFVCMQEASGPCPLVGPLLVASMLAYHLAVTKSCRVDLILILTLALAGTFVDSMYLRSGLIVFEGGYACCPNLAPLWITSLWALYASSVNHSLRWLKVNYYFLAAPLGAAGAVSSYLVGFELKAAKTEYPVVSLAVIGIVWAFVVPLSLVFSDFLQRRYSVPKN